MEGAEKEKNRKQGKKFFRRLRKILKGQKKSEEEKAKKEEEGKSSAEEEEVKRKTEAEKELDEAYKSGRREFVRISDFFSPEDLERRKGEKELIEAKARKMIKDRENKMIFRTDNSRERRVEIDPEGKLILYHATIAEHYFLIEKDSAIKPSILTGKIGWRHPSEKEPKEEVYLATREDAENFATILQRMYGGSAYILEVHLAEKDLLADKDVPYGGWKESMRVLGCCSVDKSINDYKVAKKLNFQLSEKRKAQYMARLENTEKGSQEEAKILKELDEEIARGIAAEEEQARKILDERKEEE